MFEIMREVDGCHTAVSEGPVDPIAIGDPGGERLELCGGFAQERALLE